MQLKALSIRQPWAWLIVEGWKDIENRNWWTNFRGRFYVHASKTFDVEAYFALSRRADLNLDLPARAEFHRGGIIGAATLVDCVHQHESGWFEGPFGFVLADHQRLKFVPCRGALKFFTVGFTD